MKRNSKPSETEVQSYISLYVADELRERFEGRQISDINDHEIVDIITRLLENWPRDDDWAWARKQGKKLGVTGAELLTMRWSKANALALKQGLTWAITPKQPPAPARASGTRGASRSRKRASSDPRG